jgi:ubiquinone/menaquinone biosynthesis C-methylase UbiE
LSKECLNASCCEDRRIPSFLLDNPFRYLLFNPNKVAAKYVKEGYTVADLGSGPGFYTIAFAKRVGEKGKVYAVDFDVDAINKLISKAKREKVEDIVEARAVSASEVDFIPDSSVDFVFANGLICCMTDHEGAVNQISRILKPEGKAYISVTRAFSKRDVRAVSSAEWREIISRFNIVKRGEGIAQRWALISKAT